MQNASRIILALSLASIVFFSWFKPMDSIAIKQIDTGLNRALVSYATARTLNAVISVAQGTEVAIEPGGVGVVLTPGQALDPINDLVEQFSTLMLVACVAFGVQKILISIGGYWLISMALTAAAIGWAWLHFRHSKPPVWLNKLLVVLLMIRFAIPIVTLGSDMLFQQFMAADYAASEQIVVSASGQITEISQPNPPAAEGGGFFDELKQKASSLWSQAKSTADVKAHYSKLKQAAEQWAIHIIKLIVIFLLQTLIIPVLLMWMLYAVFRGSFDVPLKRSNP